MADSSSSRASETKPTYNTRSRKRVLSNVDSVSADEDSYVEPHKKTEVCGQEEQKFDSKLEKEEKASEGSSKLLECAVCLQACVHPAKLPCNHIFCFLCLKGIAHGSKTCAMCRQPIPSDYLDNPVLVEIPEEEKIVNNEDEEYKWFYEGRNGWWQYDCRTSLELEAAFCRGDSRLDVLIAGYLYTIDLSDMMQFRAADPARRRNIKRDLASCPKKGIAGLRQPASSLADSLAKLDINQS